MIKLTIYRVRMCASLLISEFKKKQITTNRLMKFMALQQDRQILSELSEAWQFDISGVKCQLLHIGGYL